MKILPYCISDFKHIMLNNYVYVDKTRFIEMLEKEANPSQFFIRPRKFGKSLFFTTLLYYYDINEAENFDAMFGNLYIGKNPTPKRNSYAIMYFDFSGLHTFSEDEFKSSFTNKIKATVKQFLERYRPIFEGADQLLSEIKDETSGVCVLENVFSSARDKLQIFVIIDEYDQFANDLIAKGTLLGKDVYKTMITANGLVRDFYEQVKIAAKTFTVHRTFITGISPVMLDDLTSGYNIATNFTLDHWYNEMLGFTQSEVEWLINETGVDPSLINIDMEAYYNGYLFHPDGENRVYNPTMVLYILRQIQRTKKITENVIDENLKTDYSRLSNLIKNENNRQTLIKIMEEGGIAVSEILKQFSVDKMNDSLHFISLLFYLGLLTIKERRLTKLFLQIPNYSIRTLYWEYLAIMIQESSSGIHIETDALDSAIDAMAMEGDLNRFISYISENAFSKLSDHDLQHFDEKYIKILLLAYLFMNKLYMSMSEYETVPGRADIFLQRNPNPLYSQARYEWILELKYCKVSDTEAEINAKRQKGLTQIDEYINAYRTKDRLNLKAAVIVFIGKDKFEITEVL
jgi:hypothetical protein